MRTPLTYIKSYLTYLLYRPTERQHDKCVFFNLEKPSVWHRYFYVFALFFHMRGYDLYFPAGFWSYWNVRNENRHIYLLIKDRLAHFGSPPKESIDLTIDDNILSRDYFAFVRGDHSAIESSVHVPMCQHPLMYRSGLWAAPVRAGNRKRSVFFIGKFERDFYNILEEKWNGLFMSRTRLYDQLRKRRLLYDVESRDKLISFLDSEEDHRCIFIKRAQFSLPMESLRNILASFEFFLAAPGVIMPFAHNIVEAMSAGAIPLIQKPYADMFFPALRDGKEAVVFTDADDLEGRIRSIYAMDDEEVVRMRTKVLEYYDAHLTPKAVVKSFEQGQFEKIYLQAEYRSVDLLEGEFGGVSPMDQEELSERRAKID